MILKDGIMGESRKIRELGHYLLSLTVILLQGLRWDGPSWRCTSGVNLQPDYRFDFASPAVNM
jgi:hypothetical protein